MEKIHLDNLLNVAALIQKIELAISSCGAVWLKCLSLEQSDYLLSELSQGLGKVSLDDVVTPDNTIFSYAHRVEAQKKPSIDQHGFLILSTTTLEISCHTDDYFSQKPADLILFQCVRQDRSGGDSIIASLKEVLEKLDSSTTSCLKQLWYPAHFGDVKILTQDCDNISIKYNRTEIEQACLTRNIQLSQLQENCLKNLDRAIRSSHISFSLKSNDILVINNRTILHGRKALMNTTNRLLRRVKLYT